MDNSEKLAQQDEEKNLKTTQYVLVTTTRKQVQTMQIRHVLSYKQLEVKTNRTSPLCGNRNRQHNKELKT